MFKYGGWLLGLDDNGPLTRDKRLGLDRERRVTKNGCQARSYAKGSCIVYKARPRFLGHLHDGTCSHSSWCSVLISSNFFGAYWIMNWVCDGLHELQR